MAAAASSSFFSRTIPIPIPYTYTCHYHSYNPPSLHLCTSNLSPPSHFFSTISFPSSFIHRRLSPIRLHRSFSRVPSNPNRSIRRCLAGSAGPPPSPPERPDSGPANQPVRPTGVAITFSRIWDSIQIFFAVLFWMALFFWASAWDGRNSGRRNRGTRFRS